MISHLRKNSLRRVSLRTLLLVFTVMAALIAFKANQVRRIKNAKTAIVENGGQIAYSLDGSIAPKLSGPKWLHGIGEEFFARDVVRVAFPYYPDAGTLIKSNSETQKLSPATDDILNLLRPLSGVEWLVLTNSEVTDSGLNHVTKLHQLQTLHLNGSTSITDEGIRLLSQSTNLKRLDLSGTAISDKALLHLSRCSNLVALELNSTDISDEGIRNLATLSKLKELHLNDTNVSEAGASSLRSQLPNCSVTHGDLASLGDQW